MLNTSISRYRESQITSTSPEKTIFMLYDGAIRFLGLAMKELEEKNNMPEKARLIEKTVKIIDHLQSCLDQEKGGVIAENLDKLYDYMSIKLTEANLRNDIPKMREVLNLLLTIRDGWKNICDKSAGNDNSNKNFIHPPDDSGFDAAASEPERKVGVKV
ncbi:MAG TPA: flagellar export chaperone FliS [Nitrospirae bacterium]|nr:flagellar export chaperone FliS [Nitrospirota bacterium]